MSTHSPATAARAVDPARNGDLRALPRAVWVLAAGALINRFGSFVLPFLVLYLRHHDYTAGEAGIALAAYGLGKIAAAPTGGYLADRLGPRDTIVLSMLLSAAAMLALWQSVHVGPLPVYSAALLAGWASELYRPSISALIAASVELGPKQVRAFAVYQLGASIGLALGPAAGGLVATHSYAPLFIADAATSVVAAVVSLAALPGGRHVRVEVRDSAVAAMLRDRAFVRFWVAAFLVNVILFQAESTLPLWVTAHDHSSAVYGALLGMSAAMTVLFQLPLTRVTNGFPPWRVLAFGNLLAGIGFGMLTFGADLVLLVASVLVWSSCQMLSWPVASAWVTEHAPPGLVGRYAGARSLTFALGLTIGPLFGTTLYGISPRLLWLSCLALGVAATALLFQPNPTKQRWPTFQTAQAGSSVSSAHSVARTSVASAVTQSAESAPPNANTVSSPRIPASFA
jgi:MFS family permease